MTSNLKHLPIPNRRRWFGGLEGLVGLRSCATRAGCLVVGGLILLSVIWPQDCPAIEVDSDAAATNTFPSVSEVIGGRTFDTFADENIFFLQAIHDRYNPHWSDLIEANITLQDYVLSPDKLGRFIYELGEAMRDRNDRVACVNLALITGDITYYGVTNTYHPEIFQAAARALIKIGPYGRKALASAFTEAHYRNDPASLESLADVIGDEQPVDAEFVRALAATAFSFSTTNGAIYPRCTTTVVKNLLCLSDGFSAVRAHLIVGEVFDNPGRFQSVVDGIAAAHASVLSTNLVAIQAASRAKLADLGNAPGGYRDDLQELEARIGRTLAGFDDLKKGAPKP